MTGFNLNKNKVAMTLNIAKSSKMKGGER